MNVIQIITYREQTKTFKYLRVSLLIIFIIFEMTLGMLSVHFPRGSPIGVSFCSRFYVHIWWEEIEKLTLNL